MGRRPYRPAELAGRCFRGSEAVRLGLVTAEHLRGPAWRRLFHDVYADADLSVTHLLRCRAAGLILPPGAALTGRSAACVDGLPLGGRAEPVHVVTPPGTRFNPRGCRVRRAQLPPTHVRPGEPRITVPQRTAWEIAGEPDQIEAVAALDVLLHHRYFRAGSMDSWAAAHPHSRAAKALALADGRAESPQESRARLRLLAAGFPAPTPQHEVWVNGSFVARLDLAWPAAQVAVEYDGEWHADGRQLARDRARLNKLVDAGWVVLHLTKRDLADSSLFARFADQLRAALTRRQAG